MFLVIEALHVKKGQKVLGPCLQQDASVLDLCDVSPETSQFRRVSSETGTCTEQLLKTFVSGTKPKHFNNIGGNSPVSNKSDYVPIQNDAFLSAMW